MDNIKPIFQAGPIKSISRLVTALGITLSELEHVLHLSPNERYSDLKNPIYKKDGSVRVIKNPNRDIRKIQFRLNQRISKACVRWPDYLFGSIPKTDQSGNRDYVACAQVHCGAKSILKLDVSSFFDSIHKDHVYSLFHGLFRYSEEVSLCLANICCYEDHLVQGALTSSYIATLILWDVEQELVRKLRRAGLKYTRLVDDITISSTCHGYDFSMAEKLVFDMLAAKSLSLNVKKSVVYRTGTESLKVHGLEVSFSKPNLPKSEVKKIRAAVHQISLLAKNKSVRRTYKYRANYHRTLGRVNKLARLENDKRDRFLKVLLSTSVRPLPSGRDTGRDSTLCII
ncbi:reverse transcriptase family protein [Shewanella litorisediminis]|uniref:RNA-directed DNA polymerase n=1 Tax=Shewanella litorisediminis TaxID=1173586 RepID=A0ABX7G1J3_9GAMM|nr:reverse transcriptase family protein [Shewanella litorisediminis]MCL2920004.1 reverse transcriptase family protein [Shewanella litorisediminis]QRH01194.1 RNA-directed DNA polymerase [Shewanella litorisediminis]